MTTTRESVRNAIVAELRRQVTAPDAFDIEVDVLSSNRVMVTGMIDLDALADAIVEHVA